MDASNRKSGRRRLPSKKYTVDAFEGLDIDDGAPPPIETLDDNEDDDFHLLNHRMTTFRLMALPKKKMKRKTINRVTTSFPTRN